MAPRKENILINRSDKLKELKLVQDELAKKGVKVSIREISENLDHYQAQIKARQDDSNDDVSNEVSAEQREVVKTVDQYFEILTNGLDHIYFDNSIRKVSIIDGAPTECILAVVPPHLIESKVMVVPENDRDQGSLNRFTLSYILDTLEIDGQLFEADGYYDESTGIIWVVDGSSRRASCLLAEKPFKIFVASTPYSSQSAKERSRRANEYKPHSSWEQGRKFVSELEANPELLNKDLVSKYGMQESRVSLLVSAARDVPYSVYECFQSGTQVKRRTIEWLVPAVKKLSKAKKLDQFIKEVGPFHESNHSNDDEVLSFMKALVEKLLSVSPKQTKAQFVQRQSFRYKAAFDPKKGTSKIEIKDATPEIISKLEEFLQNL